MKRRLFVLSLIALAMMFSQIASAQLITPNELAKIIDGKDVVIVSTRKGTDYAKVHVNGAVNVYPNDLYKAGDIKGLLKSPAEVAAVLGAQGITTDKTIVVYDGGTNVASGRLYWILKYMGCKDVRILNGQMKNWRKSRKPVTRKATTISAATFTVSLNNTVFADAAHVKSSLNNAGTVIVDVRSKDEFDAKKGLTSRLGHIPGAIHLEYKNIFNENETMKAKEDLQKIFKDAGVTPDKEVVLYCETSARAGIVFMALTSILDYPNVKVYDGAYFEWAANASFPIE